MPNTSVICDLATLCGCQTPTNLRSGCLPGPPWPCSFCLISHVSLPQDTRQSQNPAWAQNWVPRLAFGTLVFLTYFWSNLGLKVAQDRPGPQTGSETGFWELGGEIFVNICIDWLFESEPRPNPCTAAPAAAHTQHKLCMHHGSEIFWKIRIFGLFESEPRPNPCTAAPAAAHTQHQLCMHHGGENIREYSHCLAF